jgi:hypothetical protein
MKMIESIEYKTYTIEVHQDFDHKINPREWDNLGTIITKKFWNETEIDSSDIEAVLTLVNEVEKNGGIVLPVYVYSHTIDRFQTKPFRGLPQGHAEFDSGVCGFIFAEPDKIRENFGVKRITKKIRDRATQVLEAEIKELDLVSSGQVYGYKLFDKNGNEIDSCWGYIGGWDSMVEEVKSGIDQIMQQPHTRQPVIELLGA